MIGRVVSYMVGACVAVLALGELFQGGIITYQSVEGVLLFGLIVGSLDAFVKPIISLVTLPLTCLTFGLFAFVVNAALFAFAAFVAPGIDANLWGVLAGALMTSLVGGVVFSIVDER